MLFPRYGDGMGHLEARLEGAVANVGAGFIPARFLGSRITCGDEPRPYPAAAWSSLGPRCLRDRIFAALYWVSPHAEQRIRIVAEGHPVARYLHRRAGRVEHHRDGLGLKPWLPARDRTRIHEWREMALRLVEAIEEL